MVQAEDAIKALADGKGAMLTWQDVADAFVKMVGEEWRYSDAREALEAKYLQEGVLPALPAGGGMDRGKFCVACACCYLCERQCCRC